MSGQQQLIGRLYRLGRAAIGPLYANFLEAILGGFVTITTLSIAYIPLYVRMQTVPSDPFLGYPVTTFMIGAFIVRVAANGARKLLPDRERRRSIEKRKVTTSKVLADLTAVCCERPAKGAEDPYAQLLARQAVLEAVLSHAAQQLRDRYPGTLTANLLLRRGDEFVVVARAGAVERHLGNTYKMADLFCKDALKREEAVSLGDLRHYNRAASEKKKYRDILAVPLLSTPDHLGVVTIDSERCHVFGGRETQISLGLSPYIALLKLSIQLNGGK